MARNTFNPQRDLVLRQGIATLLCLSLAATLPCLSGAESQAQTKGRGAADAPTAPSSPFGFTGPEAFPLELGIASLTSGDIDGDGLTDLIVANNESARVTFLLNRTGKAVEEAVIRGTRKDINELPPDSRFKVDSLTSEKRIAALLVTDLNQDQRPDIAYIGEPKPFELVVHFNQGNLTWSPPRRWRLDDLQLNPDALVAGDLNGDGSTDLAVLAEGYVAVFFQSAAHVLTEPEKLPYTGTVKAIAMADLDGDGRQDLILIHPEGTAPIRLRLQTEGGQMGPELYFSSQPLRALRAGDLDGDKRAELVSVAQSSGRAATSVLDRQKAAPLSGEGLAGQFQVMPFPKTAKPRRGLAWADIDSDTLADLLVAQPETGQLTYFAQQKNGAFGTAKTFPSLAGVIDIAVAAAQGTQAAEIFLLSTDERQIGVTTINAQGRISFPTPVPFEGKPLAMAVGALKRGQPPVLAAVLDLDDRRQLSIRSADGSIKSQKLSASFKSNPASILLHDANQDGLEDLVILIPYEKLKLLLQVPGKDFEEVDVALPGGSNERPWASIADVDRDGFPELLLAQKNFIRAVVLKKTDAAWTLVVKDQINGASVDSQIVGAAALRTGEGVAESLFLLDADRKALTVTERDTNGVWQITRNLPLPYSDFSELRPVGIGSPKPNSIAFLGASGVAWLALSGESWQLKELDGYETPVKDGVLSEIALGDLNSDGRKDIVVLETRKNHLDLVSFSTSHKLINGNRWQVFEERTFRSRRNDGSEPREGLVVDLNGDGRNDLAILVHNRVLLYLQQ